MTKHDDHNPSFPDFPSQYWSTLSYHGHDPSNKLHIDTDLQQISKITLESGTHDTAYFSDFNHTEFVKSKKMLSPSMRTCSSLLSEMLRPATDSHVSSPATTHAEGFSDRGSFSTRSTPPLQCSPPRHAIFGGSKPSVFRSLSQTYKFEECPKSQDVLQAPKPVRHISFGGVHVSPAKQATSVVEQPDSPTPSDVIDRADEATPVVRRNLDYRSSEPPSRSSSISFDKSDAEQVSNTQNRPKAIRFTSSSQSECKSVTSSRKSSYSDTQDSAVLRDTASRTTLNSSASDAPSKVLPRVIPATCKSTLDAMLKKEAIAKVIDTVPEEEEEEEEYDEDQDIGMDTDEDDEDDSYSMLDLDSDDDGYQEDIESEDDDVYGEDVYPKVQSHLSTPRAVMKQTLLSSTLASETVARSTRATLYRTAAPSESDLPDTTDFAPGNMDEDQPACIAFDMAVKDREARRNPARPSDIDPTFPESGSEDDPDDQLSEKNPIAEAVSGRPTCRSPAVLQKCPGRARYFSPPLIKPADVIRARSLPRRYLPSRKSLFEPKPQRAVTIKQSNEQRAQRRREKKEVRQNARRAKQEIDHNGHEKMKVHCLSRKKFIAAENPCVIRPVMSI